MNARVLLLVVVAVVSCRHATHFDASASCDATVKTFYADMSDDAPPALAEAMRAVSHDVMLFTPPEGSEHWTARDRKSFTLYQASWALLPPECTTEFRAKDFPVDDYGRGVNEITRAWQGNPRCRPDEQLFAARGEAQGTVDIGVWSFATVLAPHLDASGKAYLRKLLVCEER